GWKLTSSGSVKNPTGEVKVLHVGTLSSALCALQAGGVDVVFLDLGLPDSMGIRTLDSVRGRYPDIPIVVLSGVNSYLDKDELASRGVFRVFKKK
ncbi:MAG: response regulator, partial [Planctomycetota bacterium]|nr:response regulator [Planctomycetota bacterium]